MSRIERARIQRGKRERRCSRQARKARASGSRDSSAKNGLPEAEERAKGRRGGRGRTQQVAGREQEVWAGRRPWARGRGWAAGRAGVSAIAIRDPSPISRPRQPQPRPLDITPRPPPACENAQSSVPDWSRCLTLHAPISRTPKQCSGYLLHRLLLVRLVYACDVRTVRDEVNLDTSE